MFVEFLKKYKKTTYAIILSAILTVLLKCFRGEPLSWLDLLFFPLQVSGIVYFMRNETSSKIKV